MPTGVAVFARDATTGVLTFVEAEFEGVGGIIGLNAPGSLKVSPDGGQVYVTGNNSQAIAVFARNIATGALTFTEAEFELNVSDGEAITQAHLHCAPAEEIGPVVVFLFGEIPGGFDVDGDLAEFTLTDANVTAVGADCENFIDMDILNLADLALAMMEGDIYANVHSVENPGGEVRGQLLDDD